MTLEQQITALAAIGLPLSDGVTVDDLLYSYPRDAYESPPFVTLLLMMGVEVEREPSGRRCSAYAWDFDTECIGGTGDYVHIVQALCALTGRPHALVDVQDHVDLETETAWLRYRVDGQERDWIVEVNHDWADVMTITYVMDDLERDGHHFYAMDNGQAMVLFYLHADTALAVNRLVGDVLRWVLEP